MVFNFHYFSNTGKNSSPIERQNWSNHNPRQTDTHTPHRQTVIYLLLVDWFFSFLMLEPWLLSKHYATEIYPQLLMVLVFSFLVLVLISVGCFDQHFTMKSKLAWNVLYIAQIACLKIPLPQPSHPHPMLGLLPCPLPACPAAYLPKEGKLELQAYSFCYISRLSAAGEGLLLSSRRKRLSWEIQFKQKFI